MKLPMPKLVNQKCNEMLDTIVLQLNKNEFFILDYSKFNTTEKIVLNNNFGFKKWINNPIRLDRNNDVYKPRLTLVKRGFTITLKIEFSAPKIIFNNNVDELEEKDFELLIKELGKKLENMGVMVHNEILKKSRVLYFHPSKNILLKNGYTSTFIIKELNKIDVSNNFDLDIKTYRNAGQSLQFYNGSHAFTIYDKISDLRKSKNKAIDKDQTKYQKAIFNEINKKKSYLEILRLEIRLTNTKKIKKVMDKVGYTKDYSFNNIFNKNLCKNIIQLYWEGFFEKNAFIFNRENNPQKILEKITIKHKNMNIEKAINLVGKYLLCQDEEGLRGFRNIVNKKGKYNWYRIKKDFLIFDDILDNNQWNFIKDIKKDLKEFKTLRFN